MFASNRIAAGLFAVAALVIAPSAMARVDCRPHDRACLALHRPSTPAERARTRELNREALESATPAMPAPQPFYHPDFGYRPDAGDRQSQLQYQRELRDHARAEQEYQRELRDHVRAERRYEPEMRQTRRGPGLDSARPRPRGTPLRTGNAPNAPRTGA